ncbi:type 1 periplasmic binding fold superfamily protein [Roseivirga sp. 4D4]|uniref:type 1 periplasmic binding fold superfamily protein n=1 Tax=Roseivirga sp. 4D4 TaxID=1889784 RepID=UPI000853DC19|nr:type 1 periplasmic binding fold superfamily protein [Roseivirga sp. 4D4]OEK03362.1 type 1 periplasmic binding fold superfamily protein [Roseivirga sp. 4D4]
MKKFSSIKYLSLLVMALIISACDSDDPEMINEEELITTLRVTFTSQTNPTVTATFRDIDGPGGNDPEIINPTLAANTTYTVAVEFLNEEESPAEDITLEVAEEDDEHQVFFVIGTGLNATYAYTDQDGNGNPLGLAGTFTTAAAGAGNLTVTLIHEPDKTAANVSSGDPTNAGGETDIEVTFNVTVQ